MQSTAYKSLGERVRARRLQIGLTQVQLAAKSGLGQSAISSIESGGTKWTQGPNLLRLAAALETSPHWLESGEVAGSSPATGAITDVWSALTPDNQHRLLGIARLFLAEQTGKTPRKPSVADPYPQAPQTRPQDPDAGQIALPAKKFARTY